MQKIKTNNTFGKANLLKRVNVAALALFAGITLSGSVFAHDHGDKEKVMVYEQAHSKVTWQDYRDFTDVKPANQSRKKFAEHTFKQLSKYLDKLAKDLPEGHKLQINVTDLDLAGHVLPASFAGIGSVSNDIRIIKQVHIPRIAFEYELVDASGAVVKTDTVKLKDMNFIERHNRLFRNEALRYEKNMLKHWFESTLKG